MKKHLFSHQKFCATSWHVFILLAALLSSCTSEKLFQSGFDQNTVGQPPTATQTVGTIEMDGLAGTVRIVNPPVAPSGKWVEIRRDDNPTTITNMQCDLTKNAGDGAYKFSASMFIPTGCGPVSLQFEPLGQSIGTLTSFLHIDFMGNNKMRLNDDPNSEFGDFPRDSIFIVQVTLTSVNDIIESAHIVLAGVGASGDLNITTPSPLRNFANNFGTVRFWMGFPHVGAFDVTNIVVSYEPD